MFSCGGRMQNLPAYLGGCDATPRYQGIKPLPKGRRIGLAGRRNHGFTISALLHCGRWSDASWGHRPCSGILTVLSRPCFSGRYLNGKG
jgi:hypothetical protein